MKSPLIITLTLDTGSQERFTALRNQYFPKHCNYLEAHLTLFHHLPSDLALVDDVLTQLSDRGTMNMEISGVKNMGNGTAFVVASNELQVMHKAMQTAFEGHLISQDRHKLWPHITIQNKVTAFKAKQTTQTLLEGFSPFHITGMGFSTWLYLQGPWEHRQDYPFNGKSK